ncbi:MAG: nucleotidyltransferase domain-containing protein [Treponema sp.]|nr:nucleotidyltransferase domain-containing protein [Treponema sp.]
MTSVSPVFVKEKNPMPMTKQEDAAPLFAEKIAFIRSLILGSVEPETVKKIYLFGSYAYGTPTSKSDIDLCIIINNNQDDSKVYLKIARCLFINGIIPADILLYKENEFVDFCKSDGIENIISNKGKIIYG